MPDVRLTPARKVDDITWADEPALLIHVTSYVSDDEARAMFVEFYSSDGDAGFLFGIGDEFDPAVLNIQRGWFRKRPPLPYEWCDGFSTVIQEAPGPQRGAFPAVLVGIGVEP